MDAVKLGESELDRGEYISHEDVGVRLERLFQTTARRVVTARHRGTGRTKKS